MLHEDERLIKPIDIKEQVDWSNLEGVIIIGLRKAGEHNTLQMSSLSYEELSYLSAQLNAHLNHLLGPMEEL